MEMLKRYEEWAEPKNEKQWKVSFPEGCTVQVIIRTEESGKYDRIFQLFEDSGEYLEKKVIRWIVREIEQKLQKKKEDELPF